MSVNFEQIINLAPGYIYWKDLNSVYLGCNYNLAKLSGLDSSADIVGKTDYDFYWGTHEADRFIQDDQFVISSGNTHTSEYTVPIADGKTMIVKTEKSPLFDYEGNIIGILAVASDITLIRKTEELKIENARQKAALEQQQKFKGLISELNKIIRAYEVDSVNEKLGTSERTANPDVHKIGLTRREYEVLYLLSYNKSEREIAEYISKVAGKPVSVGLISIIIRDHLYRKFKVNTNSQLVEQALHLKLIPFMPESFTNNDAK